MADITNVFKATVKAVKSRQKSQGNGPRGDVLTNILPTSKHRGDFETKAGEVVRNINHYVATVLQSKEKLENSQ